MTKKFADHYKNYKERVRTVAGITHGMGGHSASMEMMLEKRRTGKSNYSFFSRLDLFVDFILSLSNYPMKIMFYLGVLIFLLTFMGEQLCYIAYGIGKGLSRKK
ncbi:hypothetical protein IID20_02845 [Patescibacteria group bacterium]|nr:hypothetical protein [Patescibacteria group bacterium]